MCIAGNLTDEQKQWFIDYYKKLCKVGVPDKQKGGDKVSHFRQTVIYKCSLTHQQSHTYKISHYLSNNLKGVK